MWGLNFRTQIIITTLLTTEAKRTFSDTLIMEMGMEGSSWLQGLVWNKLIWATGNPLRDSRECKSPLSAPRGTGFSGHR